MGKQNIDLTNKTFGWLTVLGLEEIRKSRTFWLCRCQCGELVVRRSDGLHDGSSCLKCKSLKQRNRMTKHGETKSKLYQEWRGMKRRCLNPKSKFYHCYGGRGITICDEWVNDYECFRDYVTQLDNYGKDGYTLDRIDVNGNYEPNNVRWADIITQANNRRDTEQITFNGKTMTLKQWSREMGVRYSTLQNRKRLGWSYNDILSIPIKPHKCLVLGDRR